MSHQREHLGLLSPLCSSADSRARRLLFDAPAPQNTPSLVRSSARILSRGCFRVGAIWTGPRASCSSECDSEKEAPRDAIKDGCFQLSAAQGGTQLLTLA